MTTTTVEPGLSKAQLNAIGQAHDARVLEEKAEEAGDRLMSSVKRHSPQKANIEGKAKRASRNPEGRPAAEFKVTLITTNGARKVQRVATSYDEAVGHALWLLSLDETGEIEIEDRQNEVSWRMG